MSDTQEIVVTSDLHFHDWRAFATGSGFRNSRLNQTCKVVRESLQYARDHDCPWLCGGDFFHTISFTDNAVRARAQATFFQYDDVLKYVVWGDHDTRGKGSTRVVEADAAIAEWHRLLENFHILDGQAEELPFGAQLYGAGAQPKSEFVDFGPGGDIGLFHVLVSGSETPSGFELRSKVEGYDLMNYRLAICGDVHHPQHQWSEEGRLLLVPGAPEHHNFGDRGERGWWVVTLEAREDGWWPTDLELHPSDSPKFLSVETRVEVEDDGNFYRIMGEEVREEDLPAGATVVGSPPTTVEARDVFQPGSSTMEVVQTWLKEQGVPKKEWEPHEDMARELLGAAGDILQLRDCRLQRVLLENFLSFEQAEWCIQDGVTLVLGDSKDFDSNGAGKSALIVEALYWGLFGKTTRDIPAEEVIRWGADKCRVVSEIQFADGTELVVDRRRSRGGGPELIVTEDGQTLEGKGVTATTDRLTQRLGLTDDIHRALSCYNQEDLLLLSRSTDAERKDLIADLCGLGTYQKASTEAGRKASSIEEDYRDENTRLETRQESLEDIREDLEETASQAEEWEENREKRLRAAEEALERAQQDDRAERAGERLEAIRERAERLKESRAASIFQWEEQLTSEYKEEKTSELQEKINTLEDKLSFPDLSEDEITQALEKWEAEESRLRKSRDSLRDEEQEAQGVVARATTRSQFASKRVKEAEGLSPGETCPECGQEVEADHIKAMLVDAKAKLKIEERKASEAKEALVTTREALESVKEELEKARQRVLLLKDERNRRTRLQDSRASLETAGAQAAELAQKELDSEVREYENHADSWVRRAETFVKDLKRRQKETVRRARETLEELEGEENPHRSTLQNYESRISDLEDKIQEGQERLESLRRDQDVAEFWNEGFSKQGIQSLLLDEVASEFNQARRQVFPILTHGVYDVQFSTQSHTAKGELREKTEFLVRYHGRPVEYGALSGGQKRRVDVGVMLTLILANARARNVPGVLGMIVLDETFDFLDVDGAEALADVLQQVVQTVPSIYVVTQNSELGSYFPQTLLIEQDDQGVSQVA